MSQYKQLNGTVVDAEGKPVPVQKITVGALEGQGGREEYVVNEEGVDYVLRDFGDGSLVKIQARDVERYIAQRDPTSSQQYVDKQLNDPVEARQAKRRTEAFKAQLNGMIKDMKEPTTTMGHSFVRWKDEQYLDAQRGYQKAAETGQEKLFNFQPLSTYHNKLRRPHYKGEVGILCEGGDVGLRDGKKHWIVLLEAGYGGGTIVQVGAKVK